MICILLILTFTQSNLGHPTLTSTTGSTHTTVHPPPVITGETPTAHPHTGTGVTPTAHPLTGTGETPTAHPLTGSGETPTAHPHTGTGETPTAHPHTVSGEVPGVVTTIGYQCIQGWSKAMSVSSPSITGDDIELLDDLRTKYDFCTPDQIITIRLVNFSLSVFILEERLVKV